MKLDPRMTQRLTRSHRKLFLDFAVAGVLLFGIGCLWNGVGRYLFLGALAMFLPKFIADAGRVLDVELLRDRLGTNPPHHGRHTAPVNPLTGRTLKKPVVRHQGAHPRPGNRA